MAELAAAQPVAAAVMPGQEPQANRAPAPLGATSTTTVSPQYEMVGQSMAQAMAAPAMAAPAMATPAMAAPMMAPNMASAVPMSASPHPQGPPPGQMPMSLMAPAASLASSLQLHQ